MKRLVQAEEDQRQQGSWHLGERGSGLVEELEAGALSSATGKEGKSPLYRAGVGLVGQ